MPLSSPKSIPAELTKPFVSSRWTAWLRLTATSAIFAASLLVFGYGVFATAQRTQGPATNPESSALFEARIRPVLDAKCVSCHGPTQHLGGVRLDGPVSTEIAQRLADAITYTGDVKMPPSGKLPGQELAALTAWAKAGAPWPSSHKAPTKPTKKFWSFLAPKAPTLPKVKASWWAKNPIDRLVLAKLEEKGLKPAPVADRRTLIRRATFDLTGLPPTPQEINDFLVDQSPNAFEKVVDRLLASPAYGERWGRHWLDVARYSDSNGLDENLVYPNAWRYRDYVIQSINADKPIDRFFQEQLAGDLLPGAGDNEIIATGFLSLGGKMLAEDDPVKQEEDIIDEQVDTTTKTFLGLTVGCARCHDHKFDPIPSKDYYSLAGIFKSTKTMLNFRVVAEWNERPLGTQPDRDKWTALETQIKILKGDLQKKREVAGQALLKELEPLKPAYEKAARQLLAAEARKAELHPVFEKPDTSAPAGSIPREAEDYTAGNAAKDQNGFGKGIGVILNGGVYPNRAEYDISVPADGPYQLDLRYASGEPRPIHVYVNGVLALANAAGEVTGGFYPQHQKWMAEGIVSLRAGVNRLKFERESYFPHIDKLLLIPRPGQTPTEEGDLAKEGLIPEFVASIEDKIKNGSEIKFELPDDPDNLFPHPTGQEIKKLKDQIVNAEKTKPEIPRAMAVEDGKPTDLKVHIRGSYLTLGENCPRGFPKVISDPNQPAIPANHSGRLELAQWMTDGRNPLTARVFVNRVWRWRFGRGIVASVDNFGTLGDLPTNQPLLDYLATSFVKDDGWSLKKLHKQMMLTNTYMMSGKFDKRDASIDPDNHFLWRFPRQRLEAEEIRDSIFFVAGKLDRQMGGTLLNLKPRSYVTSTESQDSVKYDLPRRSVYLPVIRAAVYDVYTAFDFGDPTVMNGDRSSTTVAPQALFMLNSSVVLAATKSMAESMTKRADLTDDQRVRELYQICYGRPSTRAEVQRALDYLNRFKAIYAKAKDPQRSAWQSLCKAMIAANEFIYVE